MLEANKDRLIWAILAVVVAVAIGVAVQTLFPEIVESIGEFFRNQIGGLTTI